MTTMTNIQTTQALSNDELDATVGGANWSKAKQAYEIGIVEHANMPNALKAFLIHNIVWKTTPAVSY